MRALALLTAVLSLLAVAGGDDVSAAEAPGVGPTAVRFGQSCALSGPAKALGEGMRLGILAAFDEANRAGGVHGRQLRLTTAR